ncbi:DNA alkylation repair protein [Pseudalkalibacillus caeni]|uniref:DNA alkylation repair protein n=1 Tax=Exobacillus caeni TaxID=2574798 RepID=UPI003CCC4BAD
MLEYVRELESFFYSHRNDDDAEPMKKYMRDQFEFLGIKTPERKKLLKTFIKEHGMPQENNFNQTIEELWQLPEREYQYIAISLLDKALKKLPVDIILLLEHLIVTKSWWDTIDSIASGLVGEFFRLHPHLKDITTRRWMDSGNMWLQRTAILFQLSYKTETDSVMLFKYIKESSDSDEFFIQKAIGWALREYSKTEPAMVEKFIEEESLAPLSRREGLKVIKKRKKEKSS